MTQQKFDVVVVGAGHAGSEAAAAAARVGASVALVTLRLDGIAQMSCNPAIGGVGKGHLVREIDALGGVMGKIIDRTGIQFRRLNTSRGPAVRASRAQADSKLYRLAMAEELSTVPGLVLLEDEVTELIWEDVAVSGACASEPSQGPRSRIVGLRLRNQGRIDAQAVIITTGTFLNGRCFVGDKSHDAGRAGDRAVSKLSQSLKALGLELKRFKTGTTPRLVAESIRWDLLEEQHGDAIRPRFSHEEPANSLRQIVCHMTHTNASAHEVVRSALPRSPLYRGIIKGSGPRYCPSVEDKVVRFPMRESHLIFLEPEGLDTSWVYPNGISTSLPEDAQEAFLKAIVGLGSVRIHRYGYAVEYDYAPPQQLFSSLMTHAVSGLFLAGQINGTSGYEEAAAQGLMAGLNAARFVDGKPGVCLRRDQAYIGVMIDDLTTQGVDEPYRVFTSRAEHRLSLREGNAESRLFAQAFAWGLVDEARHQRAQNREATRTSLQAELDRARLSHAQALALDLGSAAVGKSLTEILRRPKTQICDLLPKASVEWSEEVLAEVGDRIRYSGYIDREEREIERCRRAEHVMLEPAGWQKSQSGISGELLEKLNAIKPQTLGQASRIPGMTPACLALLRIRASASMQRAVG